MKQNALIRLLYHLYYGIKLFPFRQERRRKLAEGCERGFVGIQIDGLAFTFLRQALDRGYMPNLESYLRRGHKLTEYHAGLPSATPAAQSTIFYGKDHGIPAFRWFEKSSGQIISCNDLDHVQLFREKLFDEEVGVLAGGSSYSNILDGGAARSVFTVSSPHPQTLFGRVGGWRFLLILLFSPLRTCRMFFATFIEFWANRKDEWHHRRRAKWRTREGLFPLIRIFCNVILRELQTFGVIADIYTGVPRIYTTYSGYDEIAHHFGPGTWPALKNLKYIDRRIAEIIRAIDHVAGADYLLVILSDHGQTPGYPFENRFGATLGDAVSAFLQEKQTASVSSGPLEVSSAQIRLLPNQLKARPTSLRQKLYRKTKNYLQSRIRQLVAETLKVDPEGGVVITYSSTLAHLYITGDQRRLSWKEVEIAQPLLLRFLQRHKGVGFVLAQGDSPEEICIFHREGRLDLVPGQTPAQADRQFLRPYGMPGLLIEQLYKFGRGPLCGDLVLFGALDEQGIACFDDQVGGHGSVGGEQSRPFLILPLDHPVINEEKLYGYEFLYWDVFRARVGDDDPIAEEKRRRHRDAGRQSTLFDSELFFHD